MHCSHTRAYTRSVNALAAAADGHAQMRIRYSVNTRILGLRNAFRKNTEKISVHLRIFLTV